MKQVNLMASDLMEIETIIIIPLVIEVNMIQTTTITTAVAAATAATITTLIGIIIQSLATITVPNMITLQPPWTVE